MFVCVILVCVCMSFFFIVVGVIVKILVSCLIDMFRMVWSVSVVWVFKVSVGW